MRFVETLKHKAGQDPKIIVLPECDADTDGVIREASERVEADGTARLVKLTAEMMQNCGKMDELAESYAAMRGKGKNLGMRAMQNPVAFGCMMVKSGYAHGMVAGRYSKSGDVMKFANAIIGEQPGRISSAIFFREPPEDYPVFDLLACADMVVHENPNAEELCRIIVTSAETFENLTGREPRVAILSYVTGEPTAIQLKADPDMQKIVEALKLYRNGGHRWTVHISQGDAALRPAAAKIKGAPFTDRPADLLIGSGLGLANPVYKLLQELIVGGQSMFVTQGLNFPVMDLSRSDTAANIANVITACCVCAQALEARGSYRTIDQCFLS